MMKHPWDLDKEMINVCYIQSCVYKMINVDVSLVLPSLLTQTRLGIICHEHYPRKDSRLMCFGFPLTLTLSLLSLCLLTRPYISCNDDPTGLVAVLFLKVTPSLLPRLISPESLLVGDWWPVMGVRWPDMGVWWPLMGVWWPVTCSGVRSGLETTSWPSWGCSALAPLNPLNLRNLTTPAQMMISDTHQRYTTIFYILRCRH